jgi:outer membrane receptor protein involved in Fe transport
MSGNLKVDVAEFDQREVTGSIRGPLVEGKLSGGLTARAYERGGPFKNIYDGTDVGQQESQSVSGVLYFTPTEDLDIRLRSRWSNLDDDQLRLFTTTPEQNNCFGPDLGAIYDDRNRYFCGEIKEQPINTDDRRLLDEQGYDRRESWETSLAATWQVTDELSLTWINGYSRADSEVKMDFGNNPYSIAPVVQVTIAKGWPVVNTWLVSRADTVDFTDHTETDSWEASSEFRLAYQAERWNALFGGYYFKREVNEEGVRQAPAALDEILEDSLQFAIDSKIANCPECVQNDFALGLGLGGIETTIFAAGRNLFQSTLENQAVFAMFEFDATDRLTASFEVRVAKEVIGDTETPRSFLYRYDDGIANPDGLPDGALGFGTVQDFPNPIPGGLDLRLPVLNDDFTTTHREETFRSVSPRITVRYAVGDETNVYFVAAGGTKPGGFNEVAASSLGLDSYDEESVESFELGIKTSGFDGRMRFNAAIYHNTIEDYQLTESVVALNASTNVNENISVIKNAGKVQVKGIEMDVVYALESIEGLTVNANYAYADSTFLKGTDVNEGKLLDVADNGFQDCSIGYNDPTLQDPDEPPGTIVCGDNVLPGSIVGRELPNSPKQMANVGANYMMDLGVEWTLILNGNVSYQAKKWVQVHNLAYTGSTTLVGASIALENENFRFVLWGKNLTDEDSVLSASRFADSTRFFQRNFFAAPRIGRQFGATASYMF